VRRKCFPASVAVAILAGLLWGVSGCAPEPEPAREIVRPVKAVRAAPAPGGLRRSFSGTARPSREASLAFRVGGKVERMAVDVGDEVGKGEELARLEAADYELDVKNLRHNLESAQAAARNSENGYRRAKALYENSNISKDDLDGSEAQRNSDRAQVRALEAQLTQARNQLSYAVLRAPFAGTVSNREVDEYETVAAGQSVLRILDPNSLKVDLGVPESLVSRIRSGQEVEIAFESLPGRKFPGKVSEVDVAIDSLTGTYPVTVQVGGDNSLLRPGMAAEVSFSFSFPGRTGIVLPTSALLSNLEKDSIGVWVVEEGKVRLRPVKVGELGEDGIEIVSGLEGGELVVTAGVTRLEEGQQVRVLGGEER